MTIVYEIALEMERLYELNPDEDEGEFFAKVMRAFPKATHWDLMKACILSGEMGPDEIIDCLYDGRAPDHIIKEFEDAFAALREGQVATKLNKAAS